MLQANAPAFVPENMPETMGLFRHQPISYNLFSTNAAATYSPPLRQPFSIPSSLPQHHTNQFQPLSSVGAEHVPIPVSTVKPFRPLYPHHRLQQIQQTHTFQQPPLPYYQTLPINHASQPAYESWSKQQSIHIPQPFRFDQAIAYLPNRPLPPPPPHQPPTQSPPQYLPPTHPPPQPQTMVLLPRITLTAPKITYPPVVNAEATAKVTDSATKVAEAVTKAAEAVTKAAAATPIALKESRRKKKSAEVQKKNSSTITKSKVRASANNSEVGLTTIVASSVVQSRSTEQKASAMERMRGKAITKDESEIAEEGVNREAKNGVAPGPGVVASWEQSAGTMDEESTLEVYLEILLHRLHRIGGRKKKLSSPLKQAAEETLPKTSLSDTKNDEAWHAKDKNKMEPRPSPYKHPPPDTKTILETKDHLISSLQLRIRELENEVTNLATQKKAIEGDLLSIHGMCAHLNTLYAQLQSERDLLLRTYRFSASSSSAPIVAH
jgi:hypothetical protein